MSLFLGCIIIVLIIAFMFFITKYLKKSKENKKLKIYELLCNNLINYDLKMRKVIEKQCNDYLEHKVLNKDICNEDFLDQVKIVLDYIKFANMINAFQPLEEKQKEEKKSIIEKAIEENIKEEEKEKKSKNTKKGGKS